MRDPLGDTRPPGAPTGIRCRHWSKAPLALLFLACSEQRRLLDEPPHDSAALAQQEARRREFLEEQAAELARQAREDRRWREPVVVARPTVVVFLPRLRAPADSEPLQALLKAAADSARAAGWDFAERFAPNLRIMDSSAQAIYAHPVPRDSVGVALVAPGYPPYVSFGLSALLEVGAKLRALEAWLRGQANPVHERT